MTAEAGWYHCQGDPETTVRRWNGEQWIGFPIEQQTDAASGANIVGVKPFKPNPGQVGLDGLSAIVRVALALVIGVHGYLAVTVFRNSRYEPGDALDALDAFKPVEAAPTPIATAFTAVFVVGLLAGLLFIAWFAAAYRNLSLWHKTKRTPGWAAIVFFVPGIQFRWPWDMMLELIEKSPRAEREGKTSPFAVLGWWSMWSFHQTLFLASIGLNRYTDLGASAYQLAMAGSVAAMIGLCFAIFLVHRITGEQETRRRPSPAQRAMMQAAA